MSDDTTDDRPGQGGFSDVDDTWAVWDGANPGWFDSGVDALYAVCVDARRTGRSFSTVDVWARWRDSRTPEPDEGRNMARVMAEGVKLDWCRIVGTVSGHTRRGGHAGLGHRYEAGPGVDGGVSSAAHVDDPASRV